MAVTALGRQLGSKDRLYDSIDYFLIEITGKIQLSKTMRGEAEGHYGATAQWLEDSPADNILHHADIQLIPIGGLGSDTATKPIRYDEFDLDLVARISGVMVSPNNVGSLYNAGYRRFYENKTYRKMLEDLDRCIRLNYAGQFHLDMMFALPFDVTNSNDTRLWIAERQENGLFLPRLVDPQGLIKWFDNQAALEEIHKFRLDERKGSFEQMPILTEGIQKPTLKQSVELIKRGRDVYFKDDDDVKKILKSVIILTRAGLQYQGERSLYEVVLQTLEDLRDTTFNLESTVVLNPINRDEDFAESLRAHPNRHKKLQEFLRDFIFQWKKLAQPSLSFQEREKILENLFGETPAKAVFKEYGERMVRLNEKGSMRMNASGALGVSSSASAISHKVPRHEFYGE